MKGFKFRVYLEDLFLI